MRNNFKQFFRLDKINHNGQVEWEEWLASQDLSNPNRSVKEMISILWNYRFYADWGA